MLYTPLAVHPSPTHHAFRHKPHTLRMVVQQGPVLLAQRWGEDQHSPAEESQSMMSPSERKQGDGGDSQT